VAHLSGWHFQSDIGDLGGVPDSPKGKRVLSDGNNSGTLQRSCRGENNCTVENFSWCENSRACLFHQFLVPLTLCPCPLSSSKGKWKAGSVNDDQPPKKKKVDSTPTKKSTRNIHRKDAASTSTSAGPMAMEVEWNKYSVSHISACTRHCAMCLSVDHDKLCISTVVFMIPLTNSLFLAFCIVRTVSRDPFTECLLCVNHYLYSHYLNHDCWALGTSWLYL
jgi:hypothetical protein